MFKTIDNLKDFNNKISKYTSSDNLKVTTDEAKKVGENALDKIGELIK